MQLVDCPDTSDLEEKLNLELRNMNPTHREGLSLILSVSDELWKSFMGSIPRYGEEGSNKYTMEHVNIIANAHKRLGKNPVEILFDEWGTTGRKRPTVGDLCRILETAAQFNQALFYVKKTILGLYGNQAQSSVENKTEFIQGPQTTDETGLSSQASSYAAHLKKPSGYESSSTANPFSNEAVSVQSYGHEAWATKPLNQSQNMETDPQDNEEPRSLMTDLPRLNYSYLSQITDNFNNQPYKDGGKKVGQGAFGTVYHGEMNGQLGIHGPVVVKKLQRGPSKTESQFNTEIECMRYVCHENLLSLLSYSNDGPDLCLVYEFMEKGNLADNLRLENGCSVKLTALQRLNIAIGCTHGLSYLHNHSAGKSLVHRDIKPENILLEAGLNPKISDFGLIRMTGSGDFGLSVDQTSTVMGSPVYMPPEAILRGEVSDKADVYSFGVVLLELITSIPAIGDERTATRTGHGAAKRSLMSYLEDTEDIDPLVDEVFRSVDGSYVSYNQMYEVATQSIDLDRRRRPTIEQVKTNLEHILP